MSRLVIDCSITMSWCFADESSEYGEAVLQAVHAEGAIVPPIWCWEVANTLLIGERRGRIAETDSQLFLEKLAGLPIAVDNPSAESAWLETLRFARIHRLTAYDAAYVELARRESLTLCTLDADLVKAAPLAGVPLFMASPN
jgi:predicted nucleic acid-binding protein